MSFPISLLFLTTTKGHFDRKDIYLKTLQDWKKQGFLDLFDQKIANITCDNLLLDNSQLQRMRYNIFSDLNFSNVLVNEKKWKHFDSSHFTGIIEDIASLVSKATMPYCFLLEDDWLIRPFEDIHSLFREALSYLKFPQNICVRIPRHLDDELHYPGTEQDIFNEGMNEQGHLFSNNPHIISTHYLHAAINLANKNKHLIQNNCEVGMTQIFKNFVTAEKPFLAFNPKRIRCFHIGTPEGQEDKLP